MPRVTRSQKPNRRRLYEDLGVAITARPQPDGAIRVTVEVLEGDDSDLKTTRRQKRLTRVAKMT